MENKNTKQKKTKEMPYFDQLYLIQESLFLIQNFLDGKNWDAEEKLKMLQLKKRYTK